MDAVEELPALRSAAAGGRSEPRSAAVAPVCQSSALFLSGDNRRGGLRAARGYRTNSSTL